MQFYRFECIGSDEYANIRDRMHSILYSSMVHRGDAFVRAIDAAVDNAARFAADTGCAHISIRLRIMMYSIAATVAAKTRGCCTKQPCSSLNFVQKHRSRCFQTPASGVKYKYATNFT